MRGHSRLRAAQRAGDTAIRPYNGVAILLHWVSAITIVALWTIGQTVGLLPRGPLRLGIWSMHVLVGFALALIVAVRIFWRVQHLPKEPGDEGWMAVVGAATHYVLYLLMIGVLVLGITNAFLRGYNLFGLWSLPRLPGDQTLVRRVNDWHALAANALIAVAVLHAGAALFHHFVLRDGVLGRMIPVLRRPERKPEPT